MCHIQHLKSLLSFRSNNKKIQKLGQKKGQKRKKKRKKENTEIQIKRFWKKTIPFVQKVIKDYEPVFK